MMDNLLKDVRYGLRTITKSPGFLMVAVLSLALGIGANTAIFTLIEAAMLRTLPVQAPQELFSVGDPTRPNRLSIGGPLLSIFSYPLYRDLRDRNTVFSGLLAAGRAGRIDMSVDNGAPEEVRGRMVSGNYFQLLGISAAIGRVLFPEDDRADATPAVVISHDFWERRFARDAGVLSRSVRLNGVSFAIAGVGPQGFTGEAVGLLTDVWIPIAMQPQVNAGDARLTSRDANWLLFLGRRLPGVTVQRARQEMTILAHRSIADSAGASVSAGDLRDLQRRDVHVQPGAKGFTNMQTVSQSLVILMFVVGLLLLIACVNVANLLLARATGRRKEISVRLAMGAGRIRLVRMLLIESLLLAILGGAAGWLLALWGSRLLQLAFGSGTPIPLDLTPNVTVLAFTAGVSLLTAILFGLFPALGSTQLDLASALKENARSVSGSGWRVGKLLVGGQLALSLLLLIGAGLFVRSLANTATLDVGYSRSNLILMKADLAASGYTAPAQQFPRLNVLSARLSQVPGVLGVTFSENGIFSGTNSDTDSIRVPGFTPTRKNDSSANFDEIGPHYFQNVGVPLLSGREFDEHDNARAPAVAIINDTMARFYFGNSNPVGRSFGNGAENYTIVGVVKDMKEHDLKGTAERTFFLPLIQTQDKITSFHFEIRTRDDAAITLPAVRREMQAFDPNLKISSLDLVRVLIDRSIGGDRLIARLSGFFAVLALLLAANGVYGVMSYAMSRRAGEIGIRMALGASRWDIIRMVLGETMSLVAVGFAIGLPAALVAARFVGATLVGLSPADPVTFSTASLVILAAAICAALVPARRAARVDPATTLRQE